LESRGQEDPDLKPFQAKKGEEDYTSTAKEGVMVHL
jgi:hypothetical protein